MNKELVTKAKEAKNTAELIALGKENGIDLTEENAQTLYDYLHPKTGELSDEELDNVAGGGCYAEDGALLTTIGHKCKYYEENTVQPFGVKGTCCRCKYWDHEGGNGYEVMGSPLKCLNPNNAKKS